MSAKARRHLPAGGIKATLVGGNTIGGALRERAARPDGYRHVDTAALVRRLTEMSANTYLYGIWDSPTDWDDLRLEFLPAAQAAGIDVIPYIVPPSETFDRGRASRPFTLDFVRWAKEFATLSLEYPALKAWAIDDFEVGANAELFTAEYMGQLKAAAGRGQSRARLLHLRLLRRGDPGGVPGQARAVHRRDHLPVPRRAPQQHHDRRLAAGLPGRDPRADRPAWARSDSADLHRPVPGRATVADRVRTSRRRCGSAGSTRPTGGSPA